MTWRDTWPSVRAEPGSHQSFSLKWTMSEEDDGGILETHGCSPPETQAEKRNLTPGDGLDKLDHSTSWGMLTSTKSSFDRSSRALHIAFSGHVFLADLHLASGGELTIFHNLSNVFWLSPS